MWFGIIEAKMTIAGLNVADTTHQKSMFALVVGELPQDVARTVKSLIKDPNNDTAYNDIKEVILGKHQETPSEAHKWLMSATLGDQKPSALAELMVNKMPRCGPGSALATGCPGNAWNF